MSNKTTIKNTKEKVKSPAFQFYPKDFLTESRVIEMSAEVKGLYIVLLCLDWLNDGFRADQKLLKLAGFDWIDKHGLLRASEDSDIAMAQLSEMFEPHPRRPGFITNPRLERERNSQKERRLERSESGKKGALSKWNNGLSRMAQPSKSHDFQNGSAIKEPMAKYGSSSSSSSTSKVSNMSVSDNSDVLAKRAEEKNIHTPEKKVFADHLEKFMITVEQRLEQPGGKNWELDSQFISAGRRPMRDYPDIWLTPIELAEILFQYEEAGIADRMREANQLVQARLSTMKAEGKNVKFKSAASWYMGFIKREVLENKLKSNSLKKQKENHAR